MKSYWLVPVKFQKIEIESEGEMLFADVMGVPPGENFGVFYSDDRTKAVIVVDIDDITPLRNTPEAVPFSRDNIYAKSFIRNLNIDVTGFDPVILDKRYPVPLAKTDREVKNLGHSSINYKQYFNNLNLGNLVGQDSWYQGVAGISPQVQDSVVYEGAKATSGMYSAGDPSADRDFPGVNNEKHWAKFVLRTSDQTQNNPYVYIGKDSAKQSALFFAHLGYWKAYDGDGVGGGVWLNTGVALSSDRWDIVKIEIDHDIKESKCYVIDMATPKLTGLGFRHNTVDSFNWTRFRYATAGYPAEKHMDRLEIRPYNPDEAKRPISNIFHSIEDSGGFLQ